MEVELNDLPLRSMEYPPSYGQSQSLYLDVQVELE